MVLEIARFRVREGDEDGFVAAYREAVRYIANSPGCRSTRLTRGVESPQAFTLIVEWDEVTDHTEGFRNSEQFGQWRALVGPFFAEPPEVEHWADAAP